MFPRRAFLISGTIFILIGFVILLNSFQGLTGFVILEDIDSKIGYLAGIWFVVAGIFLFIVGRTAPSKLERTAEGEAHNYWNYQRLKERLRKREMVSQFRHHPSRAVKEAVFRKNVPYEEANRIYEESNAKVASGEWIEIGKFGATTNYDKKYPHATSLIRYWGPEKYRNLNEEDLEELYEKGEIGKTHEMTRGSKDYPRKLKEEEREKTGKIYHRGPVSFPETGSRVLHRHWEIEQMYNRQKKKKR